jgi:hypothetical protein
VRLSVLVRRFGTCIGEAFPPYRCRDLNAVVEVVAVGISVGISVSVLIIVRFRFRDVRFPFVFRSAAITLALVFLPHVAGFGRRVAILAGKNNGFGVGVSVVVGIVRASGGRVWLIILCGRGGGIHRGGNLLVDMRGSAPVRGSSRGPRLVVVGGILRIHVIYLRE